MQTCASKAPLASESTGSGWVGESEPTVAPSSRRSGQTCAPRRKGYKRQQCVETPCGINAACAAVDGVIQVAHGHYGSSTSSAMVAVAGKQIKLVNDTRKAGLVKRIPGQKLDNVGILVSSNAEAVNLASDFDAITGFAHVTPRKVARHAAIPGSLFVEDMASSVGLLANSVDKNVFKSKVALIQDILTFARRTLEAGGMCAYRYRAPPRIGYRLLSPS